MKRTLLAATGAALLAVAACGSKQPAARDAVTIAVIPKGTSHVYWRSIHAGANQAARELGVQIVWRGPIREDDRDSQISEVQDFISRGVSGIVLAPLDERALVEPVREAAQRNIPVVVIDSGLQGHDYVSFVATDNEKGGALGGERLADTLHGKGKVVLLRYSEGSDSTAKREAGFLKAMAAHPGIEVVSANQYGGTDVEGAYKKAESLLSTYKRPDGTLGIDGIFCPNESTSFAMLRVLQDNRWAGKVRFVGFDASDSLVDGLSSGAIDGLVVQDPVRMGYLGVKTMVAHLKGQAVEPRIDTGVHVVTRDNMNEPETKALIHPDLTKWLTN
ncbi:MAG TPA: substrate-binding domain-containing protein [Vicinamibacterales bacterium]|jgi:ribose transport system substrate-binding protein|nr:substrate-binding domain-containing protein [Vicinamibacterales bacterium]